MLKNVSRLQINSAKPIDIAKLSKEEIETKYAYKKRIGKTKRDRARKEKDGTP